jgi:hypothetical protein
VGRGKSYGLFVKGDSERGTLDIQNPILNIKVGNRRGRVFGCAELGAGCSKDGLGQDVPATMKRSPIASDF